MPLLDMDALKGVSICFIADFPLRVVATNESSPHPAISASMSSARRKTDSFS
jgi:hypothetical protein